MNNTERKRLDFSITEESSRRFENIRERLSKVEERRIGKSNLARMAIFLGLNEIEKELASKVKGDSK